MRDLLEFLIRALVDDPEAVKIDEVVESWDGDAVTPHPRRPGRRDGKVIGRQAVSVTVKAIRAVLGILERRLGKRAQVEIAEG